jgi:hypothetical protein
VTILVCWRSLAGKNASVRTHGRYRNFSSDLPHKPVPLAMLV